MVKKTAFRGITLAAGFLMSFLLAEVVLRSSRVWVGRHSDTMFTLIEYDEVLGWKMKANFQGKVDLVDVEDIPVRSNSAGFWDGEFRMQKGSGRCRITFLGDSFTWGLGVREEERFTNRLLAANPGWEGLNFGVPGYGTDQSLLLWQHIAHRYQPELVILTVYQNDYVDNMYLVRYGRRKPYFELMENGRLVLRGVPVDPADFWNNGIFNQAAPPYASFFPHPIQRRSRIVHWLAKNSDLARFFYTLSRYGRKSGHDEKESHTIPANRDPTSAEQAQVELLSALVEALAERVKQAGARLVVALAGNLSLQYRLQKRALSEAQIPYIEATTDVLAAKLSNRSDRVYYPYSGHWTPAAHRVVAELIGEAIREQGLCAKHKGAGSQNSESRSQNSEASG